MTADWGRPPWHVDVAVPAADLPARCQVAVIGGGFTGLSAAWHLARRGHDVLLLEAESLGAGASGRSGGIALEGTAAGPLPQADTCLETLAAVANEAGFDCDLRLDGCWELVHRAEVHSPQALWPDGPATLAIAETVEGGTVDPGALVSGLARAALAAGARIVERAAVTRLEPGPTVQLVVHGRRVRAEWCIVALNAYTTTLLALPVRLHPALTLAVATAPLDDASLARFGLGSRRPFYTADLPYLWGRVSREGRLVVGAGLAFPADGDVRSVEIASPDASEALERLVARTRGLHPVLRTAPITHRWGGPIAFLQTRYPLLGPLPAAPRVLVAGGYAGHGVALGVHAGRLLAAAIGHGASLPDWGAPAAEPAQVRD